MLNLPFTALKITGVIQAESVVRLSLFQAWLDAVWTPVVFNLCLDPQCRKEFMDPTDPAAFVYFLVRWKPAHEKGGRKRGQPTAPEVTRPEPG